MKLTWILPLLAILQPLLGAPFGCGQKNDLVPRTARLDIPVALGLAKRDDDNDDDSPTCARRCGPVMRKPGDKIKRDLAIDVTNSPDPAYNSTLEVRTLDIPPDDELEGYIKEQIEDEDFDLIVWERHMINDQDPHDPSPEGMGTSRSRKFGNEAFSIGTDGLTGCTVMTIVSRQGVFMGHWFEDISFDPVRKAKDENGKVVDGWLKEYGTKEKAFQQTVIDGLKKGILQSDKTTEPGKVEQEPLENSKDYFTDGHTNGYFMIPENDCASRTGQLYKLSFFRRWEQMKGIVKGIVPAFRDTGLWKEHKYARDDDEDPRPEVEGSVLLQYDPDDEYTEEDKKMTRKRVVMWMGLEKVRDDQWDQKEVEE